MLRRSTVSIWAAWAAATAALAGCRAERLLRITSDPPAADVWVDDSYRGTTPLDLPFGHYGTRRVTYRLEGHGTASLRVVVAPPWYARFPVDLFSEVLMPVGWRDEHSVHVVLRASTGELTVPMIRSVLDRAEALRRSGPRGPGTLPPIVEGEPKPPEPEKTERP
jgi:hypothetical protein